jgi:hypothetical protein
VHVALVSPRDETVATDGAPSPMTREEAREKR